MQTILELIVRLRPAPTIVMDTETALMDLASAILAGEVMIVRCHIAPMSAVDMDHAVLRVRRRVSAAMLSACATKHGLATTARFLLVEPIALHHPRLAMPMDFLTFLLRKCKR